VSLTGCATFARTFNNNEFAFEAGTRVAVGRILTNNPTWVQPTFDITKDALTAIKGNEVVTLGELEGYVVNKIPFSKLTPEERDLVMLLVSAIKEEITAQLADKGVSDPDGVLLVAAKVLSWVNQTAAVRL
jgi:hypothetical protein